MALAIFMFGWELQPPSCEFAIGDICFVRCRMAFLGAILRITVALPACAQLGWRLDVWVLMSPVSVLPLRGAAAVCLIPVAVLPWRGQRALHNDVFTA